MPGTPTKRPFFALLRALFPGLSAGLLAAAILPCEARAADLVPLSLSGGRDLRPGQEVTVAWEKLPADTEEFELLLRIEVPAAVTLRLTECQDPSIEHLSWRVPAIPCERASLLLRRGRKGCETLWGESLRFCILSPSGRPVQRVSLRSGELWVTHEEAGGWMGCVPGGLSRFPEDRGEAGEAPPGGSDALARPARPCPENSLRDIPRPASNGLLHSLPASFLPPLRI